MPHLPKTKIIATIGPSSWDSKIINEMIVNGMSIARINCSFADFAEQDRVTAQIRGISTDVAIMLDVMGHKIRVTGFDDDKILQANEDVLMISEHLDPEKSLKSKSNHIIEVSYPNFAQDITRGIRILIDDGNIELLVKEIVEDSVLCKVIIGGVLRKRKTVSIPGVHMKFPALSLKDKKDIENGVRLGVDFIAASYIRDIHDVKVYREAIGESQIKLIAKIENAEGIKNFDEIIKVVDGIMVARGDLGVELPVETIPMIQKELVMKCRMAGKPVIVATQMLESMRENNCPTRAEVSDIATAIFEGADAIMLSAETSSGKYPAQAVEVMRNVANDVEPKIKFEIIRTRTEASEISDILIQNLAEITSELDIKGIIAITHTGKSINSLTRHLINVPIWSVTSNSILAKQLILSRGVKSFLVNDMPLDRDHLVSQAVSMIYGSGEVGLNDKIAVLGGSTIRNKKFNSIIEIVTVSEAIG